MAAVRCPFCREQILSRLDCRQLPASGGNGLVIWLSRKKLLINRKKDDKGRAL